MQENHTNFELKCWKLLIHRVYYLLGIILWLRDIWAMNLSIVDERSLINASLLLVLNDFFVLIKTLIRNVKFFYNIF